MTQPDLVSKLREVSAKWREQARDRVPPEYADRDMHYKYLKLDNEAAGIDGCADELESLLGLEGQAAPLQTPGEDAWLDEIMKASVGYFVRERLAVVLRAYRANLLSQPSPSTPIVPGTAGLSADFEKWFTLWDQTNNPEVRRLCEISWKTALALAGAAKLEEAAQVVESSKVSISGMMVSSTEAEKAFTRAFKQIAEALRALAERPAPAGEVKEKRE